MAVGESGEREPLLSHANSNSQSDAVGASGPETSPASTGDDTAAEDGTQPNEATSLLETRKRLKYIVPAVGIGIMLSAADQTLVVSMYGKIGSDLHSLHKSSWISTVYFLSLTAFQVLYGKLSDIFGRKSALLFAYTVFGLGCLWCGLARSMDELILARAIAGIGGGGMTTVVSILMSDIVPLRERGTWQGIINIIYATGAGAGAPLGGLLADFVSWRFAFLIQAPLCLLAIIAVSIALDLPQKEVEDWKTKFRRVDFLGSFILILTVFSLLLGLDRGSNDAWSKPIAFVPLCLSLPFGVSFLFVEFKFAVEPLAPKRIVLERNMISCYLCNFFAFAGWMSILFYLPLYLQAVLKYRASEAGLGLLPAILASVTGSLLGGIVMQKTGKYYWLTGTAYLLGIAGILPVILCSGYVVQSVIGICAGLAVSGFGNGTLAITFLFPYSMPMLAGSLTILWIVGVTSTLIGLIANAPPEDIAIVTACSYLFRSSGSVIGLSLTSTVVQQSLRSQLHIKLGSHVGSDEIAKKVRESLDYIPSLDAHLQAVVREAYQSATEYGFLFSAVLAAGAALSSWFISEKSLNRGK